jgi:6-phosphogluconolactonase
MSTHSYAFTGAYTSTTSKGISVYTYTSATGKLALVSTGAGPGNPSFLALHPTRPVLYAVHELGDYADKAQGALSAYRVDVVTGALSLINTLPSGGAHPCHVSVDRTGRMAFVANYSGGSVAAYTLAEDGALTAQTDFVQHRGHSSNQDRQGEAHAHQVLLDPNNRFLHVCDLGMDQILRYAIDFASGRLLPAGYVRTQAGAGPRHMAFHPNGRFAYAINELDNTLNAYHVSPDGALTEVQSLGTLPDGYADTSYCADVHVSPDGRFVYGSNRGHDSLAIFEVDVDSGLLSARGQASTGGHWPRNFAIDPTGTRIFVANQESDDVYMLAIDAKTGILGKPTQRVEVARPVCIVFASWTTV